MNGHYSYYHPEVFENENWAEIPGFDKYMISDHGKVWNRFTDRLLKNGRTQHFTCYVSLTDDNKKLCTRSLPLLVATAFLPNDNPNFDTPIQLDSNFGNCHVDNLMWRPRWFARKYNRQFRSPPCQTRYPIRDIATGEVFETVQECAIRFGLIEMDIVKSIWEEGTVWPTRQSFEFVIPDSY